MASTITHKKSLLTGVAPTTGQLVDGELAVNVYDGKIYIRTNDQVGGLAIVEIGAGGGGSQTPWTSDIDTGGYHLTAAGDLQILGEGALYDSRYAGLVITSTTGVQLRTDGTLQLLGDSAFMHVGETAGTSRLVGTSLTLETGTAGPSQDLWFRTSDSRIATLGRPTTIVADTNFTLPPTNGNAGDVLTNAAGDGVTTWAPPGGAQTPWTSDIDSAGFSLVTANTYGTTNANAITARGGYAYGTGTGGPINLLAGASYGGNGGNAQLVAGYGGYGGYPGLGGSLNLTAGDSYQDPGGSVNITAGTSYATAAAGTINITAGDSGAAYGGDVTLTPGTGASYTGDVRSAGNFIVLQEKASTDTLNVNVDLSRVAINGTPNESTGALQITGDLHVEGGVNYREGVGNTVPLATYMGGTNFFVVRDYADVYTIQQIWSPPGAVNSVDQEATLALVRGDEPNQEFLDLYNNGYIGVEQQFGIRMQKRGTGVFRPFVIDYDDGTTKTPVLTINTDTTVDFASAITTAGGVDALTSAGGIVNVAAASAPTVGQVLKATAASTATWQTLVEADISDLGTYLTAEVNDLTSAVTWANIPIANVPTGITSSTVAFGDHTHSAVYQPLDTDLTNIAALTGTSGFLKTDGANVWTVDTSTYLTSETSHADVLVDGDFATAGLMKTDGAGNYSIDASTYLTSFTELNDLTSNVTWANIPIANVPTGTTGTTVAFGDHTHTGVYEPADGTILKDADIGVNVQAYNANILTLQNNMNAAVAPAGGTDDVTLGYAVGSRWFDTTADKEYVCLDNTDTAAVWVETTQSGSGGVANPMTADLDTAGFSLITKDILSQENVNAQNIVITGGANNNGNAYSEYTAGSINIKAGACDFSDLPGDVNISGGDNAVPYGYSGASNIGHVNISGGTGTAYVGSAGNVNIVGGDSTNQGESGNVNITGGVTTAGFPGGTVNINGGYGGGDITLVAGGYGNGTSAGGTVLIKSGQSGGGGGDTVTISNDTATAKLVFNSDPTITVTGVMELDGFNERGVSYGTTGAIALDVSAGTYFYPTATTTGVITFSFTNPVIATRVSSFTLEMLGAGNNNPVWPASVKWPGGTEPTWTTGIDVVSFITRDNGTTWLGMLGGTAFA